MASQGISNIGIPIGTEIQADLLLSIQRLIRLSQFKDSGIDEKRLSWDVIRTILNHLRESQGSVAGNELLKAVSGLMPQVNVQVNVGDPEGERKKLQYKAENAMTERLRNVARNQLAKLDAAASQQPAGNSQPTIDAPSSSTTNPIQAAEKLEG